MGTGVDAVLEHWRSQCAVGGVGNRVRTKGGIQYVRGLTRALKATFYPYHRVSKRARGGASSKTIGTRVHREVEMWVNHRRAPAKPKRWHRFTKQLMDELDALNLVPVASEVPLLSSFGEFLTQADLLCEHRGSDDLVVVSLKTGYNTAYARASRGRSCRGALASVKDSHRTHHQLQLALEVAVIEREMRLPVAGAVTIYVGFTQRATTKVDWLESRWRQRRLQRNLFAGLRADAATHKQPRPSQWTFDEG